MTSCAPVARAFATTWSSTSHSYTPSAVFTWSHRTPLSQIRIPPNRSSGVGGVVLRLWSCMPNSAAGTFFDVAFCLPGFGNSGGAAAAVPVASIIAAPATARDFITNRIPNPSFGTSSHASGYDVGSRPSDPQFPSDVRTCPQGAGRSQRDCDVVATCHPGRTSPREYPLPADHKRPAAWTTAVRLSPPAARRSWCAACPRRDPLRRSPGPSFATPRRSSRRRA